MGQGGSVPVVAGQGKCRHIQIVQQLRQQHHTVYKVSFFGDAS
jgi:hypothetical protein